MRSWLIPLVACVALLLTAVFGGGDAFARLALRVGLSSVTSAISDNSVLRGVALSRSGDHGEAATLFEEAGLPQTYNLATAHALNGDYADALLAYDDLLARDPNHADARANYALLVSIYSGTKLQLTFVPVVAKDPDGPTIKAPEAQGGARAVGDGSESDGTATEIFAPKVRTDSGLRRVSKKFDDMFIAASDEWLTTLLDQPGKFLAARLLAEQKRRRAAGLGVPDAEDAW